MIKWIRNILIGIATIILLVMIGLSISSRFADERQLIAGRLAPCPDTPNCVCSEDYPNRNFQPVVIDTTQIHTEWLLFKQTIIAAGGEIKTEQDTYVWAVFVTPLWRFVDDFEARLDSESGLIHVRSASRVGGYDYGTNLKRVQHVVDLFKTKRFKG
jgi:uncharacterized protein (DUF1499 family)